jgi:hypothetical protein
LPLHSAFRIANSELQADESPHRGRGVLRSACRFKTERPFYPYREPEQAPKPKVEKKESAPRWGPRVVDQRFLRVFFLATQRLGATLDTGENPWVANTAWSDKLDEASVKTVAERVKLQPGSLDKLTWLTEFEDSSSPRRGTDEVYFAKSADTSAKRRPPIIINDYEYFDEPEPEVETPYYIKLIAVVGGVIFISVLGLLVILIIRQR